MSDRFRQRYGPWALVTGASSGLGAAFARELAARGLHVVLVARRAERLRALADELTAAHGVQARAVPLDLAREDAADALQAQTAGLELGLLVNNAGFANTGAVTGLDPAREVALLHVNCRAAFALAQAYGRSMAERDRGGIVFVSSIMAFLPAPGWTHYAASKAYDLFVAEGLAGELGPRGVDVLALCPGGVATEFQQVAGTRSTFAADPARVARTALRKLGRRTVVVPGWQNALAVGLTRLVPRAWVRAFAGRMVRGMQQRP